MRSVFGIGETILDIIFKEEQPYKAVPGGSVFNGLVSLGRLRVPVTFISEVGKDQVGDLILRFMTQNHISTQYIDRFPDGYDTVLEQNAANLSGGQRQRLLIARAILKRPRILILDDSTSAVDTATDAKIRHSFAEKIPGTTVFIIAQRISSVENADKVLVLENGRVSGFDTPANLLKTNAIYQDVYNSQTKGSGDFDEKGGEA